MVKMLMPATVSQAAEKARLQELTLEAIFRKHKVPLRTGMGNGKSDGGNYKAMPPLVTQGTPKGSFNPSGLWNAVMEQRRQLGLCFKRGDKYSFGHQCKKQLMQIEGSDGEKEEVEAMDEEEECPRELQGEEGGEISFHALRGSPMGQIIKVKGQVGRTRLMMLIDSGSTHSFISETTASNLKWPLTAATPLSVTVANGSRMYNHYKCMGFKWVMQSQEFVADLWVLELGGCDIVLGVDWMKTVSPLTFYFNKLEMTMEVRGKRPTLLGSLEQGECKLIKGSKLQKMVIAKAK